MPGITGDSDERSRHDEFWEVPVLLFVYNIDTPFNHL